MLPVKETNQFTEELEKIIGRARGVDKWVLQIYMDGNQIVLNIPWDEDDVPYIDAMEDEGYKYEGETQTQYMGNNFTELRFNKGKRKMLKKAAFKLGYKAGLQSTKQSKLRQLIRAKLSGGPALDLQAGDRILLDDVAMDDFNAMLMREFDDDELLYTLDEWEDGLELDDDYHSLDRERYVSLYKNGTTFDVDADWIEDYYLETL